MSLNNHKIDNNSKPLSRRDFLRKAGLIGAAAAIPAVLTDCTRGEEISHPTRPIPKARAIKGNMSYRVNPNTGNKISIVGYGTMHLPRLRNSSDRNSVEDINQEAVNRLVDYAIDHGINFFNMAPTYCNGQCEKAMGFALSRHPRSRYFVSSKMSNMEPENHSLEASKKIYNKTFEELKVDYLDLYMLHNIGVGGIETFKKRFIDNGVLDFLKQQRASGKIRNLGFSFSGDIDVFNHAMAMHDSGEVKWEAALVSINYIDWYHPSGGVNSDTDSQYLYNELLKRDIPVLAVDPLCGGQLGTVSKPTSEMMLKVRPDDSPAAWAMRFVGSLKGVICIIAGMGYTEHLKDNVYTCSPLTPVTDEDLELIEKIADRISQHPIIRCQQCQACEPCPYGVEIAAVFERYNMALNADLIIIDGNHTSASKYKQLRRAFLVGMDCAVSKLRQADQCIGCGECLKRCPRRIDIPKKMQFISQYTERLRSHPEKL